MNLTPDTSRKLRIRSLPILAAFGLTVLIAAVRPPAGGSTTEDPVRVTASTTDPAPAPNRYVGALRCKNCHSAEDTGNQFGHWEQSKHHHAFEVLASDDAKKFAKERDIKDPQTDPKCLKCHVTAFSAPKEEFQKSFKADIGVQCETCHGPGEEHVKARMKAAAEAPAAGGYAAIPDTEIVKSPTAKLCVECHNTESPTYKDFCFHEFRANIRHLNPKKPRTDEEKAALDTCSCEATCKCRKDSKDGKCTTAGKGAKAAGGDEKKEEGKEEKK